VKSEKRILFWEKAVSEKTTHYPDQTQSFGQNKKYNNRKGKGTSEGGGK